MNTQELNAPVVSILAFLFAQYVVQAGSEYQAAHGQPIVDQFLELAKPA